MGILLTQREGLIVGNIAKILGFIMNAIFELLSKIGIENIGLCIIIFTVVVYTLMLPMTVKQQKFTRLSAVMNPEIQKIQKKYQGKNDQASMMKMQEEQKLIYEKYGTSPTGGCLGSLIQLPILFALWPIVQNVPAYVKGLKEAYMPLVEGIMAQDGFKDVMVKIGSEKPILISPDRFDYTQANTIIDVLYKFQESTWDTLSSEFPSLSNLISETKETMMSMNYLFGINIAETPSNMITSGIATAAIGTVIVAIAIPVLAGLSQVVSMKVAQSRTNNSNQNKDNPMIQQMDMMMKVMPIMSVFMCFSMPSGLGIYWITSAVVRTIQQVIVNKQLDKKSIDELIKENQEKAAKKNENKKEVEAKQLAAMAQTKTRRIEDRNRSTNANIDSYKKNAKPGSLASKSNMVSDFNNRNK
jgi:YidC/Oxa1 family membrane protein insertase